jgi:carbon-monoxide dehydrogenase small subunit
MENKVEISLNINSQRYDVSVESRQTLADVIRQDCGLSGTHIGCEQGVCGSCTVVVDGDPVRSCLMFAVQAEGTKITHYSVGFVLPGLSC